MARHVTPSSLSRIRLVRFWIGCHYYYHYYFPIFLLFVLPRSLCWYFRSQQVYIYIDISGNRTAIKATKCSTPFHCCYCKLCARIRVHLHMNHEIMSILPLCFIDLLTWFSVPAYLIELLQIAYITRTTSFGSWLERYFNLCKRI